MAAAFPRTSSPSLHGKWPQPPVALRARKLFATVHDVSANANYTFYVCADQKACTANLYGGTSFAAPMWAGYLALANEQAVTNSGSVLGFLNPLIYTLYAGSGYDADFHDIKSGSNGYSATVGYDLATGLGSPNGPALINALAGSVSGSFSLSANPTGVSVVQGKTGHINHHQQHLRRIQLSCRAVRDRTTDGCNRWI